MARRNRKTPPSRRKRREPQVVHLLEYEITSDPIPDPEQERLPADVQEQIQELHALLQSHPGEAVPVLLDLIERYPALPLFSNYLAVAYSNLGQTEKVEEVIQENLRRHPDYLFARLNYAEGLLREGRYEEFADFFDRKFDLKLLYPHRSVFHISEFASFSGLVGCYWVSQNQLDPAEQNLKILLELAPDHPLTERLQSMVARARMIQSLREAGNQLQALFYKKKKTTKGRKRSPGDGPPGTQ